MAQTNGRQSTPSTGDRLGSRTITFRDSHRALLYYKPFEQFCSATLADLQSSNLPVSGNGAHVLSAMWKDIADRLDEMVLPLVSSTFRLLARGNHTPASFAEYRKLFVIDGRRTPFVTNFVTAFPALYETMSRVLENARSHLQLCMTRLKSDLDELLGHSWIRTTVLANYGPCEATLARLIPTKAETHGFGQKVTFVDLEIRATTPSPPPHTPPLQLRIVYKPFGGACTVLLQELISSLPAALNSNIRAMKAWKSQSTTSSDYCWTEFLTVTPCGSVEEVERFWHRAGIFTALGEIIGLSDAHFENIFVVDGYPVLVDCETLFQPRVVGADDESEARLFQTSLLQSPPAAFSSAIPDWIAGFQHSSSALSDSGWEVKNERTQYLEIVSATTECTASIPMLSNEPQYLYRFSDHFLRGYDEFWDTILTTSAVRQDLEAFQEKAQNVTIRVILRPTSFYSAVLNLLPQPKFAIDVNARSKALEAYLRRHNPSISDEIAQIEMEALNRGDVPSFYARAITANNYVHIGENNSPLKYDLGEQLPWQMDLEKTPRMPRSQLASIISKDPTKDFFMDKNSLIECANSLAQDLLSCIETSEDLALWGVPRSGGFYEGLSGTLVFLSAMFADTQLESLEKIIASRIKLVMSHRDDEQYPGTGGLLSGPCSDAYAVLYIGIISKRLDWTKCAAKLVLQVVTSERIQKEREIDLVSGLAGCLAVLVAIRYNTPIELLDMSERDSLDLLIDDCRMTLLNKIQSEDGRLPTDKTGYAHGCAGIIASLAYASRFLTNDGQQMMEQSITLARMEDKHFDGVQQNWIDLRDFGGGDATQKDNSDSSEGQHHQPESWCYGSPGILLSRSLLDSSCSLPHGFQLNSSFVERLGDTADMTVCCGLAGMLDAALSLGKDLAPLQSEAQRLVNFVRTSPSHNLGFFQGISGIGYTLMRLHDPVKYPSPLHFPGSIMSHPLE